MDCFLLFGLIGFSCLILGVLGYAATTNSIIKDQERELEILKRDNERLRSAIVKLERLKRLAETDKLIINGSKDELFKEW